MIAQPPFCTAYAARHTAVVVLAAGASRRLGRPKQLVRLRGEPLVRRVVRLAAGLRPAWIGVVVGADATRVAEALAGTGAVLVPARHWRSGMAASLAAGVRRAPRQARYLAVLSVDQWRLGAADLRRLWSAAGRQPAAAWYAGHCGIPAIFPQRLRSSLLALRGERGARALLEACGATAVPMPAAATDLDTASDLRQLRGCGRGGD